MEGTRRPDGLGTALAELAHGLLDPSLPRFIGSGTRDRLGDRALVAVREPVERAPGGRVAIECAREVGRDIDLAGSRVELEVDVQLVAGLDASGGTVLGGDPDQEFVAIDGHGVAICIAVDGDDDRWSLA